MAEEARTHGAGFRFFYGRRTDLDGAMARVKCVRTPDGRTLGIEAADLLAPLDTEALRPFRLAFEVAGGRELALAANDVHHNEKGNLLVMRSLAAGLRKQGLLPAAARAREGR